jgi:uncharacterized BrkB/YihY/UPF0761 family membrane protein
MDNSFWPLLGTSGLLVACLCVLALAIVGFLGIWLWAACLVDAFRKTDAEFPDRTLWLTILGLTIFFGFSWLAALVYYFMYHPRLDFWNHDNP